MASRPSSRACTAVPVSVSLRSGPESAGLTPAPAPYSVPEGVPSATAHAVRASSGYRPRVRTDLGPGPGRPLVRMPGVSVAPTLGHRRSYIGLDAPRPERRPPAHRAHPRLHRYPHLPAQPAAPAQAPATPAAASPAPATPPSPAPVAAPSPFPGRGGGRRFAEHGRPRPTARQLHLQPDLPARCARTESASPLRYGGSRRGRQ
jgi:hypothetical protein